jgi:hypothetical protein
MTGLLLTIALISGIIFLISFLADHVNIACGVIFTIVVWHYVLVLGIIAIVLSFIGLLLNAYNDLP